MSWIWSYNASEEVRINKSPNNTLGGFKMVTSNGYILSQLLN